jgi:hypothetical protein
MAASPSPNDLTRQQLDELDTLLQRMLSLPLNQPEPAVAYPPPPPLPDLTPSPVASWRADTPTPAKTPHLAADPTPSAVLPFAPAARSVAPESPPVRLFEADPFSPRPLPTEPPAPRTPPEPQMRVVPTPAEQFAPTVAPGTLRGVDAPALPMNYRQTAEPPIHPVPSFEPGGAAPRTAYQAAVEFPEVNPFAETRPADPLPAVPTSAVRPVPIPLWPLFAVNWLIEFTLGWFGPLGHILTRQATKTLLGWVGVLLAVGAGVWAARGLGWVSWPR